MRLILAILMTTCFSSCGVYGGTEGLQYNPNDFIDFQTPETQQGYQDQITEAFDKGYDAGEKKIPKIDIKPIKIKPVDSGKIEVVSGEEVLSFGGDALKSVMPFSGVLQMIVLFGIGMYRRGKNGRA